MKQSIMRIKALVKKEFKDFPKNINVSLMCLVPLVLVFLLSNMQANHIGQQLEELNLLMVGLNINLVMVSTFAVSMLIAEEKEKNTMRTLMLSSVTPLEFLAGKAVVILLLSILTNTAIFAVTGMDLAYLGHYILWSVLITVIMMEIGGIIGLIAKNQMSTSMLGVPVIFAFMMLPLIAQANEQAERIASVLPNQNLELILKQVMQNQGYSGLNVQIITIFIWIALMTVSFVTVYQKKRLDS